MKKIVLSVVFVIAAANALTAQGKKKSHKQTQPDHVILQKNPNFTEAQVQTYALTGEVEIRTTTDTAIFVPYGDIATDTDIYVIGYNSSGNISFYSRIGGKGRDGSDPITGLCGRMLHDSVFCVTGFFSDTAYIGTTMLVGHGLTDAFVACYDTKGDLLWVTTSGGAGADWGTHVYCAGAKFVSSCHFGETNDGVLYFGSTNGELKVTAQKVSANSFDLPFARTTGMLIPDPKWAIIPN